MKLISAWLLIFHVFALIALVKRMDAQNRSQSKRSGTILRSFGLRPAFYNSDYLTMATDRMIQNEQTKKEAIVRERLAATFRKIINERLMPLTRGNSFMRDFYSGRY